MTKYHDIVLEDVEIAQKENFTGNIKFEVELDKNGITKMDCFKNTSIKEEDMLDRIQETLDTLKTNHFIGKVEFKVNMKNGGIANMNCTKYKLVKL